MHTGYVIQHEQGSCYHVNLSTRMNPTSTRGTALKYQWQKQVTGGHRTLIQQIKNVAVACEIEQSEARR